MAASLVGGALLSAAFNVLLERLTPELIDSINFIGGKKLDAKLLRRLKPSLMAAKVVLNDAELKQFNDRDVKGWLDELRDAVYELEDLVDEIVTRAATQKKVRDFSLASLDLRDTSMADKLEEITATIEYIVGQKDVLLNLDKIKISGTETLSWRPPVTSRVEASEVYGREKEKEDIIKLMFNGEGAQLSVIPIVGMGGVGKTTLVNSVYNDEDVRRKFDFHVWVCVSEAFDFLKIAQTIVKSVSPHFVCDNMDLNLLQRHLAEKLEGKRFLAVLDDVWSDKYTDWDALKNLLHNGVQGCKILVTTRLERVALIVKTISSFYPLKVLSDEDCLSIFAAHAFHLKDSTMDSCLEKIGRDVANKCKGLPLAAKVLGGLFRSNPDFEHWNSLLKDVMWDSLDNEIIPALRVSYYYLPSHLKQCFAYCSLFPEDYEFDKTELVLMWMAEGFLQPSKGNSTLEEVGYWYIDDLTSRSFFQPLSETFEGFVMHDLIHELATHVAGDFYFRLGEGGNKIGNKTRHLSCNFQNYPCLDNEVFQKLKGIRTFIGLNFFYIPKSIGNASSYIILSNMKYLRTLSFEDLHALQIVPELIEKFIHLRYLNLSGTSIACLPNSICKLYNLQTLKLRSCDYLETLPSDMRDLVNLRHLDIRDTCLKEIPRGLGNLKDLQFLSDFIVGEEQETGIRELGGISHLKGRIVISKLENVKSGNEAYDVRMMEKKHIKDLTLSWSKGGDVEDSTIERDILSNLQPCWDLEKLEIECYRGTIFPDWLGSPSYHNMTLLQLYACVNCCLLPALGQLPTLKQLYIEGLESVVSIGDELLKGNSCASMIPFPCLEYLWISDMTSWEQWHSTDMEAFPKLRELQILSCKKLIGNLPCQLLSLEILEIRNCPLLSSCIPTYHKLQELETDGSVNVVLQEHELPPSLCKLAITGCRMLETMLEALFKHSHLQQLTISHCSNVSTPMIHLPLSLQHLKISRCEKVDIVMSSTTPLQNLQSISIDDYSSFVKFKSDDMEGLLPNLRKLSIWNSHEMESFPEGILVPSLRELHISCCKKLLSHHAKWHLPSNITYLSIHGSDVKCFPEGYSLPTSLTTLELVSLHYLETLNCTGLQHLTSLQQLKIRHGFHLEKLSGEKLPASLRKLHIWKFWITCRIEMQLSTRFLPRGLESKSPTWFAKSPSSSQSLEHYLICSSISKTDNKGFADLNLH
ncbi:hypothetical protein K1719_001625 [Acacia pycnantha]|nr:hypothetical protein K1719_001625 [Acacia pycnantha]